MDASAKGHKGAHRSVTARELCRYGSGVLDDVEFERRVILVTRSGRAVALLTPLPHANDERAPEPEEGEIAAEFERLEPIKREFLLVIAACAPRSWLPQDLSDRWREINIALVELEIRKLVRRDSAAFLITPRGARVAARHLGERAG